MPDLSTIDLPEALSIIEEIKKKQGEIYIYYITNDVGIHTFRSVLHFPSHDWFYLSPGLGVNLNPHIALLRSLTESVQGYVSNMYCYNNTPMRRRHQFLIESGFSILNAQNFKFWLEPGEGKLDYKKFINESSQSITQDLEKAIKFILNAVPGSDIVYIDLTTKKIDIPVIKVIVPKCPLIL
ncbi:MAG: YcaO-like family protein [Acidobacteria bacterium]|nr:YcaO-like family protein [Acidobacteriota bacterium]